MAAWMLYATLVGALIAAACHFAEPVFASRYPSRFIWLVAIVAALGGSVGASALPRTVPGLAGESVADRPSPAGATQAARDGDPAVTDAAESRATTVDAMLILAWLCGTLLCVAVLAVSARRIATMKRQWRETMIAGIPVLVSHDVGPAVIGLVHHGIVVPRWVESLDEEAQRMVMIHEREHIKAGDPLLLWGATLLVAVMPWNVALWFSLRRLKHAIEIDCDRRVLASRPDEHAYCALLLDVGQRTLAGLAPIAALAEPATLLERRIHAMTTDRRIGGRAMFGAIAAAALIFAACRAPRPEVAPQTSVASLMRQLEAALASDLNPGGVSDADRARLARQLAGAAAMRATEEDTSAVDIRDPNTRRWLDSLTQARHPEAYQSRTNAMVVAFIFASDRSLISSQAKEFPLPDVFDTNGPYASNDYPLQRDLSEVLRGILDDSTIKASFRSISVFKRAPHLLELTMVHGP